MAAGISGCSDIVVIKINAKRKIRVEKIELESIMSGTTIGYLSALIFFAIMKKSWLLSAGQVHSIQI